MTGTTLVAPKSQIRVVGIDLFSHEDYLIGDYDDCAEAFSVVDQHNIRRLGAMDDVYYAYDDTGLHVRGDRDVDGPGVSP